MKIAVTSKGPVLNSDLDPRFGRCTHFLFVDSDSMEFISIENPGLTARGGAGPTAAQAVLDAGAAVVLTGEVGPNARAPLDAAGVKVVTAAPGTVKRAIGDFLATMEASGA